MTNHAGLKAQMKKTTLKAFDKYFNILPCRGSGTSCI